MIIADNNGLFSRVINDFGPFHKIIDTNGEPATESMIELIEPKNDHAVVTLIKGALHGLQEGDTVELSEIKGMHREVVEEIIDTSVNAKKSDVSVNGHQFKVKEVVSSSKFIIDCDMTMFTKYERDGVVKQIKTAVAF